MARRRRRKMNDGELRTAVERAIQNADFFESSEVSGNFQAALNSYLGRDHGQGVAGERDEKSSDVAMMVEAVTAQILPAFKADELAVFEADGPDDVAQARLESKICNQVLFDFNDGEVEIQQAVRDGLLLRNAILRCDVREEVDTAQESYQNLSAIELQAVLTPTARVQDVDITSQSPGVGESVNVNITRTSTFRKLSIRAIDPVNFVIEREFTSINPQDAAVVGERNFETRGDLVAEGFPRSKVDMLKSTSNDTRIGSLARNRNATMVRWDSSDPSVERIEVYRLYMRIDHDGDGIPERRKIIYAGGPGGGGQVLLNEPHSFVPYAAGCMFLYPHRFQGLSLFDKLADLEATKSRALNQYTNNMENANFPELVVADGEVAEGDVTTRRTSGVIRADRVDSVRALPVQDIGVNSLGFLRYLDKVRSELGGASLDLQSAEAQIAGESAYGVERLMTPREMLANMMADTLGATLVKQLYRLIHKQLRRNFPGPIDWHVGQSQFVTADAGRWIQRDKVRITAGMSEHQRNQQRSVLEQHLLQQEKLFTAGLDGVLMDLDTYYDVLVAWSKSGNLLTPRRFWIDPRSDQSKQAQQQKQQQAQQEAQQQQQLQQQLATSEQVVSQNETRVELVKHLTELRFKYWDRTLNSELEELRIEAQGSEEADPDPERIDADQERGREQA